MEHYLIENPNIERGVLYTINVSDAEAAVSVIKDLLYCLSLTYQTAIGYISLNDNIEQIRQQCAAWKSAAVLNWVKQKNPDCGTVIRRMQSLYNNHVVRAFIVDGSELLKTPGEDGKLYEDSERALLRLEDFAERNRVPVIAIITE